ncbi:MAG: serine/threonine protein kinase [Planctomycetes bacterium]|nr:serine/threonine protein kinase [Planctomycetota bacterium]
MSEAPDFGARRDFYTFEPQSLANDLPQFEILREVGKGSMGVVYEARQRATGRRVALKILPPSLTLTERALARFLREGRIMARVRHPAIVGFVDQGTQGRLHWFAMEFVDGVTLEQRLKVGPLPVQRACAIAAAVGRALQYAHEHGVVHRDVKPGNLMLRDGDGGDDGGPSVAITDFGLARETGTGSMTESGAIVGTPMYMAPELVLGGTVQADTLGDVYALGATLYALVTGRPPFDGPTAQSVLRAVVERDPPAPTRLRSDLPTDVETIILKAMARDPAHRYGSALEFAEDLERFLRGERILARRASVAVRTWRWCARRPLLTVLWAAVVLLSIGAFVLLRDRDRSARERDLVQAERLLALASTERDDQDRPRSADERRDLLLAAVAAASATIARDESFAPAWFVRARAHHRLRQYGDTIYDLDAAARLRGGATAEILLFRIDALRQLGDATSMRRLQQDLAELLRLDPNPHTRALVADHLLDLAAANAVGERGELLARARDVLQRVGDDDARAAVVRARILELEGEHAAAVQAMQRACQRHAGNLYVHLEAAALFERNGDPVASERERGLAARLAPGAAPQPQATPLDLEAVGRFLGDVDQLLQSLDREPPR